MLKKIFSLFVCAMMCLISTNLVFADGTSYYQESLHELIAAYKEKVGAKKVVLAGCSNGGYMTLLMGLAYPQE